MERESPLQDGVLDTQVLAQLTNLGGPELVADMIDLFLVHGPERLDAALAAEREGDVNGVRRAAHSLASTAGTLGARVVQRLAARIEDTADKDPGSLSPLMRDLELRFAEARAALENERKGLPT